MADVFIAILIFLQTYNNPRIRAGASVAPASGIGMTIAMAPVGGSCSRLATFSIK
jgi:hypothetical protein